MSTTYRENGSLEILDPVDDLDTNSHTAYKAQKAAGENATYYLREPEDYQEIQAFLAADTVLQETDLDAPQTYFDDDTGLLVTEYLGDTVENAIHQYERKEPPENADIDSLLDAVIGKLAVGDNDIAANIMIDTETGDFAPIDFENAGTSLEQLTRKYRDTQREEQHLVFSEDNLYSRIDTDIRQITDDQVHVPDDRYTERINRFIEQIDINRIAERFRENSYLDRFLGKHTILQNLDNLARI